LLSFVGQKTLALTERSVQNDEHDSSEFSRKDTNCGISAGEIDMLNAAGLSPDDLASLVVNHRNGSTTYFYDLGKSLSLQINRSF
jgi:hypothetical protein